MATKYTYTNKISGRKMNSSSILISGNGIIETINSGTALRYTPSNNTKITAINSDSGYDEATMPNIPEDNMSSSNTDTYRKYNFGIESVSICHSSPSNVAGFITKEIEIKNCSYIQLAVIESGDNNVEYSIIDGIKETPILPVTQTTVKHEKLFYGLSTRFDVNTDEDITIYKNGVKTANVYGDISTLAYGLNEYDISYMPKESAHTYYPTNTKIKVKIVQRCDDDTVPTKINSIAVLRYGGDKIWNM